MFCEVISRTGAVAAPLARTRVAPPRAPDEARSRVFLNTVIVPSPLTRERTPKDATRTKNAAAVIRIIIRSFV